MGFQFWHCLALQFCTAAGAMLAGWKLSFTDPHKGMCANFLLNSELGLFHRACVKFEVLPLFWKLFQLLSCGNGLFHADILFLKISKNCTLFLG